MSTIAVIEAVIGTAEMTIEFKKYSEQKALPVLQVCVRLCYFKKSMMRCLADNSGLIHC